MSTAKKIRHENRPKVIRAKAAAKAYGYSMGAAFGQKRAKRPSQAKRNWNRMVTHNQIGGIDVNAPVRYRSFVGTYQAGTRDDSRAV